jgi:hypothetical protein
MGECATSIDIGDQCHRCVSKIRHSHVHDVAGPKVGLGRATAAFDDHHVELVRE